MTKMLGSSIDDKAKLHGWHSLKPSDMFFHINVSIIFWLLHRKEVSWTHHCVSSALIHITRYTYMTKMLGSSIDDKAKLHGWHSWKPSDMFFHINVSIIFWLLHRKEVSWTHHCVSSALIHITRYTYMTKMLGSSIDDKAKLHGWYSLKPSDMFFHINVSAHETDRILNGRIKSKVGRVFRPQKSYQ